MNNSVVGASIIDKIVEIIINPILVLLFAAGLVMFMWGLLQFMRNVENAAEHSEGKQHMLWGLIGMFIMVAVQGIIGLVVDTLDIRTSQTPFGGGVQRTMDAVNPFMKQ
jgi:uncharacterized membrane protein YidH (DUF202 family)